MTEKIPSQPSPYEVDGKIYTPSTPATSSTNPEAIRLKTKNMTLSEAGSKIRFMTAGGQEEENYMHEDLENIAPGDIGYICSPASYEYMKFRRNSDGSYDLLESGTYDEKEADD